jgi:hypothetical protein
MEATGKAGLDLGLYLGKLLEHLLSVLLVIYFICGGCLSACVSRAGLQGTKFRHFVMYPTRNLISKFTGIFVSRSVGLSQYSFDH